MTKKTLQAMRSALSMTIQRCYNQKCPDYRYYGGRGITVCDRWLKSFDNFLADMGLRPEGMTLERVDNDGPYDPKNCVWASRQAQVRNRRSGVRITYQGRTQGLSEWAAETGIPYGTLKARVGRLNYSPEEALTKPVKCGGLLPNRLYKRRRKPDMSRLPRGFDSPLCVLTREQVREIQRIYRVEQLTFTEIAKRFQVSISTASRAAQGLDFYGEAK